MKCAPLVLALPFLAAFATGAPCGAQETATDTPMLGVLATRVMVARSAALSTCPSSTGGDRDVLDAIPPGRVDTTCTVERADSLGAADGARWTAVRYRTRYVYPADSIKRRYSPRDTADTTDVLDVVLYSSTGRDTLWRAEWHGWANRRDTWDIIPTVAPRANAALFSILSCVNGTGGCEQHFVLRSRGAWTAVREEYHAELEHRFPNAFWKGVSVDVRTLRGTQSLYSNGDANCCPSRELRLTLALRGNDMVVAAYRIAAVPPGR